MRNSLAFFGVLLLCAAAVRAQQPDNRPAQPPAAMPMRQGYPLPLQAGPPQGPPATQEQPPQQPPPGQPGPPPLPQQRQAPPERQAQPQPKRYYVELNGQAAGPFTLAGVLEKIRAGQIQGKTLVWKPALTAWVEAESLGEFRQAFAKGGPPEIPLERRLERFMTGQWQARWRDPVSHHKILSAIMYHADGRFSGYEMRTVPGYPAVNAAVEGTWSIRPASEKEFVLSLLTAEAGGERTGKTKPLSFTLRIVDHDTLQDVEKGYLIHRVTE